MMKFRAMLATAAIASVIGAGAASAQTRETHDWHHGGGGAVHHGGAWHGGNAMHNGGAWHGNAGAWHGGSAWHNGGGWHGGGGWNHDAWHRGHFGGDRFAFRGGFGFGFPYVAAPYAYAPYPYYDYGAYAYDGGPADLWYCRPLNAYYPNVQSCPVPWEDVPPPG